MTPRRAWIPVAAVLSIVYLATLAPSVTLWDAGEFIAAIHALGIPHPPGTPLFILLVHSWASLWPVEWYPVATNSFSALATIVGACVSAMLVSRWMRNEELTFGWAAGVAAALCAGTMSTVWSNATETEVYAASLGLAMLTLGAADRAGRDRAFRWRGVVAYCFGLGAALHVSVLVAAPAVILLASSADSGEVDIGRALSLGGAALVAMAVGTASTAFAVVAAVCIVTVLFLRRRIADDAGWREMARLLALTLLGATPLLFLLIRSRFDPAINQGNPSSVHAMLDVIGRRQYDAVPLWPRRAPLWLQLANWFEYADWQAALSLGPTVIPTVSRVLASVVLGGLAVFGSLAHRRVDRRSWRALLVLFVCGSLGVVLYLNLKAGPSFGWGVLPANAPREARERDYFFVLGFWAAGLWAGIGAVALARRFRLPVWLGIAAACSTIALNWSAVNRRAEPEAALASLLARAEVAEIPERAVLFLAGDNDSYSLWFLQQTRGMRRDISPVTLPLLGAGWYDDEIRRRNPDMRWRSSSGVDAATSIAAAARNAGRPVVAGFTLDSADRARLGGCWQVIGFASLDVGAAHCAGRESGLVSIDTIRTGRWVAEYGARAARLHPAPSVDPMRDYLSRMLQCPAKLLERARRKAALVSLDSTCNP